MSEYLRLWDKAWPGWPDRHWRGSKRGKHAIVLRGNGKMGLNYKCHRSRSGPRKPA